MAQIGRRRPEHELASFDSWLNILFLAAFPLLLWVFQGSFTGIATALVELWLFSVALRMIARGQEVCRAYHAAEIVRRPRLPRKIMGCVLIGVMVLILAGHHFHALGVPMLYGAIATALGLTAFGLDPLTDKGFDNEEALAMRAAQTARDTAEKALGAVADRIAEMQDADLIRRTEASRSMVVRVMRSFDHTAEEALRICKPVAKFTSLLQAETERLEAANREESAFARRRFVAKLDVMSESFEARARKSGLRRGHDAFDMEADLLLHRMPAESSAA